MIVAENIKNYPGIKDGAEYLKHAKDLLKQTQLQIDTISNTFEKKEVSGVLFYSMSAKVRLMDKQITQQFNTTVKNNFSLSVIYTYLNEEQEEVLQNTFEGIQFKN
ncbi:MAG: hypothetical protein C0599_00320 [Salinivirgaceae bacterium]|nr:MAG: hypothetical protein C0599_00320 [Salinivirgaceae bacterium]